MSVDDIIFAICRGGWPESLTGKTDKAKLMIAKDLFKQTYLFQKYLNHRKIDIVY